MQTLTVALLAVLLDVAVQPDAAGRALESAGGPSARGAHVDEAAVSRRNVTLIIAEALAVAWYGKQNWWQEGFSGDFHTVKEGWFGQNTMAGGADKLGHFYTNYAGTRLLARAFRHMGNDADEALLLGTAVTLGSMTAVEVVDGYSKRWRFSREDALMNAAGAAAGVLLERSPRLDALVDLRVHYVPAEVGGDKFDPFGDYSGLTYVVAFKASGMPALRARPLLRYLELSVGYGTRNYSDDRPDLVDKRRRQLYVGISLNLAELLGNTVYRRRPASRTRATVDTVLEYVQVPGTAVFARHRIR